MGHSSRRTFDHGGVPEGGGEEASSRSQSIAPAASDFSSAPAAGSAACCALFSVGSGAGAVVLGGDGGGTGRAGCTSLSYSGAPAGSEASQTATAGGDRKSTRLNSIHVAISYAVFCLKKKKT